MIEKFKRIKAEGPLAELQDSIDQWTEQLIDPDLQGTPIYATKDTQAKFGQFITVEGSADITITLPKATINDLGKKVIIAAGDFASTAKIETVGDETINGSGMTLGLSTYTLYFCVVIGNKKWLIK